MNIRDVALRRIIDSRGNPTIEAEIRTKTGFGRAAAPAGASTGTHEAMAWPEGSVAKGMKIAEEKILPQLIGLSSDCLLYTSPSPRDKRQSRMPSSA